MDADQLTPELDKDAPRRSMERLVMPLRVLRLTLKRQWFDMIASGEKREEYREPKAWIFSRLSGKEYDVVEFANGYGPNVPTLEVEYLGWELRFGGRGEWGAVSNQRYVVIHLGRVLSRHNDPSSATALCLALTVPSHGLCQVWDVRCSAWLGAAVDLRLAWVTVLTLAMLPIGWMLWKGRESLKMLEWATWLAALVSLLASATTIYWPQRPEMQQRQKQMERGDTMPRQPLLEPKQPKSLPLSTPDGARPQTDASIRTKTRDGAFAVTTSPRRAVESAPETVLENAQAALCAAALPEQLLSLRIDQPTLPLQEQLAHAHVEKSGNRCVGTAQFHREEAASLRRRSRGNLLMQSLVVILRD